MTKKTTGIKGEDKVNTVYPTDYQMHLFHEGNLFESYKIFGAHLVRKEERVQTRFCVWAPNAEMIRLVGDFNDWNGEGYSLHRVNTEGIWVMTIDQDLQGALYKYEIFTKDGERFLKADPFSFYAEKRPNTASIIYDLENYRWQDQQWMQKRDKKQPHSEPMAIYEVHLGSWKKSVTGGFLSYKELAADLIPYVVEQGFTHIELMPLIEHPLDESWGYQGTGYYSVTSRYGEPYDFMYFIEQCHLNGIGVILDWVPGHFCKDAHGLYEFDGTHLYEYEHAWDRENTVWGTANFDLGKNEVQSFLISNAIFWMDYYHIDGFRLDAVSNILYWPNRYEKNENPMGIQFLQKCNQAINEWDASVLVMAEDSTDWPQVTAPVHYGGLGFQYKWNMGWMNDVLTYMETQSELRSQVHGKMTFSLFYAFSENFVLPFSHDEVVHGKKSLLNKMPGDYEDKFAQLRLLLGYMFAHPGKKLLFMGAEFGQFAEWKDKGQLDWHLLEYELHQKLNVYVKELLKLYRRSRPFYELDFLQDGFEWIDVHNYEQSIFSFIRKGKKDDEHLVVICNFTGRDYTDYRIGMPKNGSYREIFNSDRELFGGTNLINKRVIKTEDEPYHGKMCSITMTIAPYSISVLRPVKHRKERIGNGKEKEKVRSHVIGRREREQTSYLNGKSS